MITPRAKPTRPKTPKRLFAEKLCVDNPNIGDWGIAKLLYNSKHKKDFKSFENARDMIRMIRGHHGSENRDKHVRDKSFYTSPNHSKIYIQTKDSQEYRLATKKKLKKSKYYIITWAQNNTSIHDQFWKNILAYSDFLGASIHVVLGRYKNPTRPDDQDTEEHWADEILPYADANRHNIHKHLELLSDIKIQPTASNPLSGLEGVSGLKSCIVGHPKRQFKVIASLEGYEKKMMFTTGSVTKSNFSDSKAGKKGEFHFTSGFVIVEIASKEVFIPRQVSACSDGSFTDLIYKVKDGNVTKINKIEYFNVGDRHNGIHCPIVEKQQEKLLNYFQPNHTIVHDIADGYSVNHHIEKDPIQKYRLFVEGKNLIKSEIENLFRWVDKWLKYNLVSISSNHNDWFDRYIKSMDWKKDISNAMEYIEFSKILLSGKAPDGIIAYLLKERYGNKIRIVGRNDSFRINKISHHHGDLGINGAKGSAMSFKKLSSKQDIGHGHTPFVEEGVYGLGTSTLLRIGYNYGASNWLNADIICHKDGKRQHLIYMGESKQFTTFKL